MRDDNRFRTTLGEKIIPMRSSLLPVKMSVIPRRDFCGGPLGVEGILCVLGVAVGTALEVPFGFPAGALRFLGAAMA